MRSILFINRVYPPVSGATAHLLAGLAESLAREGWRVTVVTGRGTDGGAASELRGGVRVERVASLPFTRASHWKRALSYLSLYPALLWRAWRLPRADVVVTMTDPPLHLALGVVLKWTKGGKLVHWAQDIYPELAEHLHVLRTGGGLAGLLRRCSTFGLRRHDLIVVLGRCMKQRLLERGLPEEKMRLIPNWAVPMPGDSGTEDGRAFRAAQGITDRFVIMYSGNLGLAHRFEGLIGAARILNTQHPRALFLFVGDGPRLAEVQAATAGLDNVRFLPMQPLDRLAPIVYAADVHVATMNEELSGLVVPSKVYGVVVTGRPFIFLGPKDGEIGLLLAEKKCGFTFPSRDGHALAECVGRLLDQPGEVKRLGENAKAAAGDLSLVRAVELFQRALGELKGEG